MKQRERRPVLPPFPTTNRQPATEEGRQRMKIIRRTLMMGMGMLIRGQPGRLPTTDPWA